VKYAAKGLSEIFNTQNNFRIQIFIGLLVLFISLFLNLTGIEFLWIAFAVMIVLLMESLNTVIEKIMDFINPEYNHIVGKIKDISAAIVLIAAVFSVVIGVIIFGRAIFNLSPKYGIIIAIIFLVIIVLFSKRR
jgi:diacylglycerol kinase (ATP)